MRRTVKVELGVTLCSSHELGMLDCALESILPTTTHDVHTTLYLSTVTDELLEGCLQIAEKYHINFEPRGDNSLTQYNNELKHRAFDLDRADCAMTIQPDTILMRGDIFDSLLDRASEDFDTKYMVCISSNLVNDTSPLGMVIHTRLGWEQVGCEDINFYPQAGSEHDCHRRSYISYGLDPEDTTTYLQPLAGQVTPPWVTRLRSQYFYHVGKPWHRDDPRLEPLPNIDYVSRVFFDCVLEDRWAPYYVEKWGDTGGHEMFLYPFNNEKYSMRIDFENCENPYPEAKSVSLRGQII